MDRNCDVIALFQNTSILRRPRVANFADNIKIATMFIKTTFKDLKKVKGIRNYLNAIKIATMFIKTTLKR